MGSETRQQTTGSGSTLQWREKAEEDAIAEWNKRAVAPSPQAQAQQGLTDERIEELFQEAAGADEDTHIRFARAIERELRDSLAFWEGEHCGGHCIADPCRHCDGTCWSAGEGQRLQERIDELQEELRASTAAAPSPLERKALDAAHAVLSNKDQSS